MEKTKNKILFIVLSLQVLAFNFIHPVTPTLLIKMNFPTYTFGLSFGYMALSSFLMSKFWEYMCSYFPEKNIFAVGCVCYGVCQLSLVYTSSMTGWLFARFCGGIFISATNVSALLYIKNIKSRE